MEKILNKYVKLNDNVLVISDSEKVTGVKNTHITSIKDYNNNNNNNTTFDVAILIFQSLDDIKSFNLSDKKIILILKVKKDFDFQSFIKFFNWVNLDIYNKKADDYYFIVAYT